MNQTYSRSRQQAEIAFDRVQSQFLARSEPLEKVDPVAQAREAKTARLWNARMARDALARAAAVRS
jgi:hypothetical protein